MACVFSCDDGRAREMQCLKVYAKALGSVPLDFTNFLTTDTKGNKRKRNDRFADTRHHETPVYGRDEQSPHYGRDTDFHNYGSKRDDVYSEFFGTDMLMSDTGPVAKTDKIFLNHSPMKGSQTRVKRHLHTDLHTHYIKFRHRRENEDHVDEQSRGESAPSTKNDTKVNFNIFTPALCGAFKAFVRCSLDAVDECPRKTVYYVCKFFSVFSQIGGGNTTLCDTDISQYVRSKQTNCTVMARKPRAPYLAHSETSRNFPQLSLLITVPMLLLFCRQLYNR